MKKAYVSYLLVVLSFCLLITACSSNSKSGSIVYLNKQNNFSIDLPNTWVGKYKVTEENDDTKQFIFRSTLNESTGGVIFILSIWNREKWDRAGEELMKNIHLYKVGEDGDKVYLISRPTDVQYETSDEAKKKEYLSMSNDFENIKSTFKLNK